MAAGSQYKCTFSGCEKAYTKPCRLEEHERSHTGEVRFPHSLFDKLLTGRANKFFMEKSARSCARPAKSLTCDRRTFKFTHARIFLWRIDLFSAPRQSVASVSAPHNTLNGTRTCTEVPNHLLCVVAQFNLLQGITVL
jgi:hypothetical protein